MSALQIGIVGLGEIAQKAWLPVLTHTEGWQIAGAFSPNQEKARPVCASYRIPLLTSLEQLAAASDAVFVHSSTASHYGIVDFFLRAGVDVCVDKPLAATLNEAERLVELADKRGRKLMVAFNRRFAPRYLQLKSMLTQPASLRMDKHRSDSVGPDDLRFTLMDDYLHVVDSALWLSGGEGKLQSGTLQINDSGQMLYAEHHFAVGDLSGDRYARLAVWKCRPPFKGARPRLAKYAGTAWLCGSRTSFYPLCGKPDNAANQR